MLDIFAGIEINVMVFDSDTHIIINVKYKNKSIGNVKSSKKHINNKQVLLTGPLTNGRKMALFNLNSQYI